MSARGWRRAFCWLAVMASACAEPPPAGFASSASAITNGTQDDGDPAVIALVSRSGVDVRCTATLIAPRVAITAAHCAMGDPRNLSELRAFFGTAPAAGGLFIDVVDGRVDPGYDETTFAHDLALIHLAKVAPIAPSPLLRLPVDATFIGASARLVGFGVTASSLSNRGVKREGTATLAEISDLELLLHPGPSLACIFDSGGPTFLSVGGTEFLSGVTSRGDANCSQYTKDTRIDSRLQAFVDPYLGEVSMESDSAGCAITRQRPRRLPWAGALGVLAVGLLVATRRRGSACHLK